MANTQLEQKNVELQNEVINLKNERNDLKDYLHKKNAACAQLEQQVAELQAEKGNPEELDVVNRKLDKANDEVEKLKKEKNMIYGELAHAKALVTSDQRNAYNKLFAEHKDMLEKARAQHVELAKLRKEKSNP